MQTHRLKHVQCKYRGCKASKVMDVGNAEVAKPSNAYKVRASRASTQAQNATDVGQAMRSQRLQSHESEARWVSDANTGAAKPQVCKQGQAHWLKGLTNI